MKTEKVHDYTDAQIAEDLGNSKRRLFELRQQSVTEKIENPRQFGKIKKHIARLLTEQRARELAAANTDA
ncbi:MAG: 50S ribosomal protein L29 [Planctomycetota bacterium]